MPAGAEGAGPDRSLGISIRLPFEEHRAHPGRGDRVVAMKYFFTRKLMLIKESSGFVCLPGGFGTQDETFELLTLLQTGKATPAPVVLLDVPGATYWTGWRLRHRRAGGRGAVSPDDDLSSSPTTSTRPSPPSSASGTATTRSAGSATASSSACGPHRRRTRSPTSTSASPTSARRRDRGVGPAPRRGLRPRRPRPPPPRDAVRPPQGGRLRGLIEPSTTSRQPRRWPRPTARPPAHDAGRAVRVSRRRTRRRVGLAQDTDRLLDRPAGPRQPALVDRQLVATGVDALLEPLDGEVGQLLGDPLEPLRMSSNSPATRSARQTPVTVPRRL